MLLLTVKVIEYDNMEYTNRGMVMVMNATSDFVHDSSHTSFDKLASSKGNKQQDLTNILPRNKLIPTTPMDGDQQPRLGEAQPP